MSQKPPSQINMKRGAFRTKIRREWLDNFFQEKRSQLLKTHQNEMENEELLRKRCSEWFDKLPQNEAVDQLHVEYDQNKQGVIKLVKENLDKFIDTAHEINIKTFNIYTTILQSIVIYFPQCKKDVMVLTMRMMLGQGQRLMKEDLLQKHIAIMALVEFILVLSDCFFDMDQLLIITVCDVLNEALAFGQFCMNDLSLKQCYIETLEIVNQFLIASVNGLDEKEDQENIEEKDEYDLLYAKKLVITKIFLQNPLNIKTIMINTMKLCDDYRITVITLKVLTNTTYFTIEPTIYHTILQSNFGHLMFSVMSNFPKKFFCFRLLISVMNNLLLFDKTISKTLIQDIYFKVLVNNYNSIKGDNTVLIEDFCQVLGHLVFFMEEEHQFLKYLMDREVVDILIEGCQLVKNQDILPHLLACFSMLMKVDENSIKSKIRENAKIFEDLAEDDDRILNQIAVHLLKESFNENGDHQNHPIDFYHEKDIDV